MSILDQLSLPKLGHVTNGCRDMAQSLCDFGNDNQVRNTPYIVDRKCSQTSITYPPAFTLLYKAPYIQRYSIFRVFLCFWQFYVVFREWVKNGPINHIPYREQSFRAPKNTYYHASSWIFLGVCQAIIVIETFFQGQSANLCGKGTIENYGIVHREKLELYVCKEVLRRDFVHILFRRQLVQSATTLSVFSSKLQLC